MAMTVAQANAANLVFRHATGAAYPRERVIEAFEILLQGAHARLYAGEHPEKARQLLEEILPADPDEAAR